MQDLEQSIFYYYGKIRSYIQPYYSTEFKVNRVIDNLYIGDFASACNLQELTNLGITHIVTIVSGIDPIYPDNFTYKIVHICDNSRTQIYDHFDQCVEFIDTAIRDGGKVYVHCMCGVSRSATIVAAYLIKIHKYNDEKAIQLLKDSRACINPNEGFRQQLKLYSLYSTLVDDGGDKDELIVSHQMLLGADHQLVD
jgi:hypothetical protein